MRFQSSQGVWLDESVIADVAGDADLLLRLAKCPDDEKVDVIKLCRSMTRFAPWMSRLGPEAHRSLENKKPRVILRAGLPPARARFLVCHELAEIHYYDHLKYVGEDIEARCDALGAALVAPRRLARAAIREHGHRVHRLAHSLGVPQALALLRVGELDRRPVLLLRPQGNIARGALFEWPQERVRDRSVHPIKLSDEDRWGLMAAA